MQADGHLLAHVIDQTPIGIMILQRDMTIVFVNQYLFTLFGGTREDFVGLTVYGLANQMPGAVDAGAIVRGITEGTLADYKLTLTMPGRPDLVCLLDSFSIEEIEPYPECFALVLRDITEEQASADLIEAKNVEMAKINTELARTNTDLKKVSELKSNFLSIASHELNTPLTSIKGYSDIIIDNMRDKVDKSVYRMIESISRAADRLHRVVNNILDVTKIEQGRLRLRPEHIDLGAVMSDCADDMVQIAEKRGITIRVGAPTEMPRFYGDKARIQQMFTSLLNNAIKFSPDGTSIDLGIVLEGEGEGKRFHITVADQGIGIDKNEHKNIFDPFYEVGNANRHSSDASKFMGGGSGLGLSIVKGIVERHGGRVWVESEGAGRDGVFPGSVFHVALPLRSEIGWDDDESRLAPESRLKEANDTIAMEAFDDGEFGKPVILFIDSDKVSIEVAGAVVENMFDFLVAESGEQGLVMAFSHRPSLILMDSNLPGLDGYRICKILRSQPETKNIPIAFFSAGANDDEIQKCFASGADDFIVKPFSGSELNKKIVRLLMKKDEEKIFK